MNIKIYLLLLLSISNLLIAYGQKVVLRHKSSIRKVLFSIKNNQLFSAGAYDKTIIVNNIRNGDMTTIQTIDVDQNIRSMAISDNSFFLCFSTDEGNILVYRKSKSKYSLLQKIVLESRHIDGLIFVNNTCFITCDNLGQIIMWEYSQSRFSQKSIVKINFGAKLNISKDRSELFAITSNILKIFSVSSESLRLKQSIILGGDVLLSQSTSNCGNYVYIGNSIGDFFILKKNSFDYQFMHKIKLGNTFIWDIVTDISGRHVYIGTYRTLLQLQLDKPTYLVRPFAIFNDDSIYTISYNAIHSNYYLGMHSGKLIELIMGKSDDLSKQSNRPVIIKGSDIRLRSFHSLDSQVICLLQNMTKARIVTSTAIFYGIFSDNYPWHMILLENGISGWVYGKYISISK